MKPQLKIQTCLSVFLLILLISGSRVVVAQTMCTHNVDTIYGMTVNSQLYPINVNDGHVGALMASPTVGVPANTPLNANAMGYNTVNGKLYYFYRCSTTPSASQLISYDPAAQTSTLLGGVAPGVSTKIRSGCVNSSGTGYYCFEITTGVVTANLWYYNFSPASWTKVATIFKNGATDYTANFKSLNSGDMAFDAAGNLWIIISNSANYAMYKISGPVPITLQAAGVTVQEIIPVTPTPGGVSFTGLAFNANGVAYLTTGSGVNPTNGNLYRMNSVAGGLTFIAQLTDVNAGDDLTSCVLTWVLPVKWVGFSAQLKKGEGVQLKWDVQESGLSKQYEVQRSTNASDWETVGIVKRKSSLDPNHTEYSYNDVQYKSGKNYYRIAQEEESGEKHFSTVESVVSNDLGISVSPNPAKNTLYLKQRGAPATHADVFDNYGRLVLTVPLGSSYQGIDISGLLKGSYLMKLRSGSIETDHCRFVKL
jgi:hypothetical protein